MLLTRREPHERNDRPLGGLERVHWLSLRAIATQIQMLNSRDNLEAQ